MLSAIHYQPCNLACSPPLPVTMRLQNRRAFISAGSIGFIYNYLKKNFLLPAAQLFAFNNLIRRSVSNHGANIGYYVCIAHGRRCVIMRWKIGHGRSMQCKASGHAVVAVLRIFACHSNQDRQDGPYRFESLESTNEIHENDRRHLPMWSWERRDAIDFPHKWVGCVYNG